MFERLKNRDIIVRWLMLSALLLLTVGCSDDEVDDRRQMTTVELAPYASDYIEVEANTRATTPVQPAWAPSGYYLYSTLTGIEGIKVSNEGAAIRAYFTQGTTSESRKFRVNSSGKWLIVDDMNELSPDPMVASSPNPYYLYGYVPYDAADKERTTIAPYDGDYSKGAVLTLRVGSVLNQDLCFVVGAKEGISESTFATGRELKTADFSCMVNGDKSYIFLLFDHLYAALRFRFRVDEKYAALRTIKLKTLELEAYSDRSCTTLMKKEVSTVVTLKANDSGDSPVVGDITFTPVEDSGNMSAVTIYSDDVGGAVQLFTDRYTESVGFVPRINGYYLLRSTYDVYDNNVTVEHPEGNLIRKDCVAENKINPNDLTPMGRGKMYILKFTVQPTYLYVLSEPDLDSPTVTLE